VTDHHGTGQDAASTGEQPGAVSAPQPPSQAAQLPLDVAAAVLAAPSPGRPDRSAAPADTRSGTPLRRAPSGRRDRAISARLRLLWAGLVEAAAGVGGWLHRVWLRSAYTVVRGLRGREHPWTATVGERLGMELFLHQDYAAALVVRRAVADGCTRTGRPADVVRARFDLGCTLHAAGHCDDGVDMVRHAWQDDLQLHGEDLTSLTRLITVAALLRACNRPAEATPLLARARLVTHRTVQELPLAEQVHGAVILLATQPPDLDRHHLVCARRGGSDSGPPPVASYRVVMADLL
jgi:hypothetical protein